jgi:hypothetical protein
LRGAVAALSQEGTRDEAAAAGIVRSNCRRVQCDFDVLMAGIALWR